MGTPSTPTVHQVLQGYQKVGLSTEQKIALLEARRILLKPHLKYMPRLVFFDVYRRPPFEDVAAIERAVAFTKKEEENLRGCYCQIYPSDSSGEELMVGLNSKGEWVILQVEPTVSKKVPDFTKRFHLLETRTVTTDHLVETLGRCFDYLWQVLIDYVKTWEENRKQWYEEAVGVLRQVRWESTAVETVFKLY